MISLKAVRIEPFLHKIKFDLENGQELLMSIADAVAVADEGKEMIVVAPNNLHFKPIVESMKVDGVTVNGILSFEKIKRQFNFEVGEKYLTKQWDRLIYKGFEDGKYKFLNSYSRIVSFNENELEYQMQ